MVPVSLDPMLPNVVRVDYPENMDALAAIPIATAQANALVEGLSHPRAIVHYIQARQFPPGNALQAIQKAMRISEDDGTLIIIVADSLLIQRITEVAGKLVGVDEMLMVKSLDEAYQAIRKFQAKFNPA